jgi:peptidyl-prolyl cis-trans isomerase C
MRMKALGLAAVVLLAGCGGGEKDGEPLQKGQTVATVNGKDITIHELNAELMGVALPAGEQRKQVEQAALQGLVSRTILADIARERGIDKSPAYMMQRRRANEALLVQMLQGEIASKISPPTREEANAFIQQNPDLFANRKVYLLDQIQFQAPGDIARLREFAPLQTMEQVERKLIEDRIEYRRGAARMDSVGMDPAMVRQIERLPEGEVFIVPNRGVIFASRITGAEVVPFAGEPAINYAMNLIQRRKVAEATQKELKAKIEAARASVKYQSGFAPPEQPKAAGANPKAAPAPAG